MPPWLRRRRRFEGKRWASDREAAEFGGDALERAVNWMQYVLGRDYDGEPIQRAIVVCEVGEPPHTGTVYTTHDVDATGVEVRGLLSEALRAHSENHTRSNRHADVQFFAAAVTGQLLDAIEGPASERLPLQQADGLLKMQTDCLRAAAVETDETVRSAYLQAADWAEKQYKEFEPSRWVEEYEKWRRDRGPDGSKL